MGNNVVKSILVAVLLIVLSFSVGVSAAEDAKGAGMIIAACCALFAVMWMKEKIWLALFYLPVLVCFGVYTPIFPAQVSTYVVAIVVMVPLLLNKKRGRVQFEWRSLPAIDIPFFLFIAIIAYSLYRFPVLPKSVTNVIGISLDYSGGADYLWGGLALLAYLVYSVIPIEMKVLEKHVNYIIKIAFVIALVLAFSSYIFRPAPTSTQASEITVMESRFNYFLAPGKVAVLYLIGTKSLRDIFSSMRYFVALMAACIGVLVSGSRGHVAALVLQGWLLMFLRREASYLVTLLLIGYGGMFFLSEADMMNKLPFGLQRISRELPGIKMEGVAADSAAHSTLMRDKLAEVGFDPNSGYIKDYVWGDGLAIDYEQLMRLQSAPSMVEGNVIQQFIARNALHKCGWHNGLLNIIHPLGYVGLAAVIWLSSVTFIYVYIVLRAYVNHPVYPLLVITMSIVIEWMLHLYARLGAGGLSSVFNVFFISTIMAKVFYCEGVKHGLIVPMLKRKSYIPLAVQERRHEEHDLPEYPLPRKLKKTLSK